MLFATLYHKDSDGKTEIWEILEGSGNPAEEHIIQGMLKMVDGQWTEASYNRGINIQDIQDIEQWKRR